MFGRICASGKLVPILVFIGFSVIFGELKIFDDTPKILYVYHDSVNPSRRIEEWIDKYFDGNSPIDVVGGPQGRYLPVRKTDGEFVSYGWVDEFDGAEIRELSGHAPDVPIIVMMLTNPREDAFVRGPEDTENIELLSDELVFACDKLVEQGATKVIWSTYHYNYDHRRLCENEPYIVEAFRRKTSDHLAVDLVTPTSIYSTDVYTMAGDRRHVSGYCFALYSYHWLKTMLEHDGLTMPEWGDSFVEDARSKCLINESYFEYLGPNSGKYHQGQTLTVRWKMPGCGKTPAIHEWGGGEINRVGVALEFRRVDTTDEGRKDYLNWFDLYPETECKSGSRSLQTVCCDEADLSGTYQAELTISERIFDDIKIRDMAVPVNVLISTVGIWKEHHVNSTVDWSNPENMILLYPDGVDETAPIYSYPGHLGTVNATTGIPNVHREPFGTCLLRNGRLTFRGFPGTSGGNGLYFVVRDSRGRTVYQNTMTTASSDQSFQTSLSSGLYFVEIMRKAAGRYPVFPVVSVR